MRRSLSFLAMIFALMPNCAARDYHFSPSDISAVRESLSSLEPGDRVFFEKGEYKDAGNLVIKGKGTYDKPIEIYGGQAVLSGHVSLQIGGEYITLSGLRLVKAVSAGSTLVDFKASNIFSRHCRMTSCVIDDCNNPQIPYKAERGAKTECWINLQGENNRIDHCYFANKKTGGLVLQILLSKECHLNNHIVDHNVFSSRPPYYGNGAETIRIGHSWSSQLESHSIIEDNVFYHSDGESEIISVKSCHNIIRRNLFYESEGGLVCRHGHDNILESNVFVGNNKRGTCGIRVINQGQTLYDNMVCRVGGFALHIRMGIFERPTDETDIKEEPLTSYHRVMNLDIFNNKFCGYKSIEINMGNGEKEPRNVRIWNNIFKNPSPSFDVRHSDLVPGNYSFCNNIGDFADHGNAPFEGFEESVTDFSQEEKTRVTSIALKAGCDYDKCVEDIGRIMSEY